MVDTPQRICDYEGSDYRTDFWEGQGRDYEDRVERQMLRQLLPQSGQRLLEIGAGFGRLTAEYQAYEQVVLLDYSFSQLQYARERLGDERYLYVAADAYHLPFKPAVFDAATMIRVLHHFENVPAVFNSIHQVLCDKAYFILEYANKHNLKARLRYRMGRQRWNPNVLDPVEFVDLNYNFHPAYIDEELANSGFENEARIPVSFFRVALLKKYVPTHLLASLDALMQRSGWMVAPSIFTKNIVNNAAENQVQLTATEIFACPQTGSDLQHEGDFLINAQGMRWQIRDGIYDFKTPVS